VGYFPIPLKNLLIRVALRWVSLLVSINKIPVFLLDLATAE
jgi:hypothetical protein